MRIELTDDGSPDIHYESKIGFEESLRILQVMVEKLQKFIEKSNAEGGFTISQYQGSENIKK